MISCPLRLSFPAWLAVLLLLGLAPASVWAQDGAKPPEAPKPPAAAKPPTPPQGRAATRKPAVTSDGEPIKAEADPVVGSVEGHLVYLSELGRASQTLPESLRGLPFETLYPVLLDRMIDHQALVIMARRNGLEENPQVKREIQAATERILEGAWLGVEATPKVTEQAIQDRYNKLFANRPATEEVRARHILVTTEPEALKILDDLKNGADFTTLAKLLSKDPDGQKGGDIGFFRREQVWPGFSDMAFALQPGQIGPKPIRNEFGWHIIKVDERRLVAPPGYSEIHDKLRQELTGQVVQEVIAAARSQMAIHRFNLDGSEMDTGPRLRPAAPASR